MARTRSGEAISARGRSASARKKLRRFIRQRAKEKKLDEWRRGRAVLGYVEGRRVVELAVELDVTRGSVNRWLQWYEALGIEGLVTATPPGASPKLTDESRGRPSPSLSRSIFRGRGRSFAVAVPVAVAVDLSRTARG